MAKKKVNYLSDVPMTESKDIPHAVTGTVHINIYKIEAKANATYIVTDKAGGEPNHYRLDYESLIPKNGGSCKAFAMRDDYDLIFVAKISDGTKIIKTITTTFEDYYKWSTAKVVHIDNKWAGPDEYWYNGSSRPYYWNGNELRFDPYRSVDYNPYTYMSGYITDEEHSRIAGSKKSDVYRLANQDGYVYDEGGNDKYTVVNGKYPTIYDYAGNDVYSVTDASASIYDYKGNDKYMSYSEGSYSVEDFAGNDSYEVYDGCNDIMIEDFAGNDKYKSIQCADGLMLYDTKGNDSYEIVSAQYLDIEDEAGNDKYTISHSYQAGSSDKSRTSITDYKGKDTYNITNVDRLFIEEGKEGATNGGNDTYNLTKVVNTGSDTSIINDYSGNDKYTIRYSDYLEINDSRGSDKYLITDHSDILRIDDKTGNDVYTVSNYSSLGDPISDYEGKDKYTVTGQSYASIEDMGTAKDTYNVFANSKGYIYDEGGNDTYNVDLSSIVDIDDRGGKDTLKIAGSDKSNLIFMANFKLSTTSPLHDVQDGSLFIFDKSNNGYIEIENFFALEHHGDTKNYIDKDKKGSGFIENVFAGKTNVNSLIASYTDKCEVGTEGFLGSTVAQWLSDNGYSTSTYSSIEAIMDSNIADEFITTFVAAQ